MDIVSAYTPTPYYAEAALLFRTAVESLGVTPRIIEYPDRGSWVENCRAKAVEIAAMRRPGHSLLWIDVDNVVSEIPPEPEGVDFAGVASTRADRAYWGGVLYFADTPAATRLLYRWIIEAAGEYRGADEVPLEAACQAERDVRLGFLKAPGIRPGLSGKASEYNREWERTHP